MAVNYREAYRLFVCNGILFNHESPRRGETFVTRKISRALARIVAGQQKKLYLGNLEAKRDWGYVPEYVEAMWLMLQQEQPDDYVIGTGESHSVGEFVEEAFAYAGVDWREHVEVDPQYFRPRRWTFSEPTPQKPHGNLAGLPRSPFASLSPLWSMRIWKQLDSSLSVGENGLSARKARIGTDGFRGKS